MPAIKLRLGGLLLAMLVAFTAIGVRLYDLQARDQPRLHSLAIGQRVQSVPLPAERGSIFDRNGVELAMSVPQTTISADPRVIDDPVAYAAKLAPVVGVDQATLQARFSVPRSAFAYVARKVDDATVAKVKALDLPGLAFTPESKRFYPSDTLAGPVLGFVGTDNTGLGGIESQYEDVLAGKPGEARVERDPQGNELPGSGTLVHPAERGTDLVLTLDQTIQWNTEQVLTQQVAAARAKGGTAIVVDVRSGDVLAMATVDGAAGDQPAARAPNTRDNAPVTISFEPGSTNKTITMAGAIEEGLVTPDTVLDNVWGSLKVGDTEYKDEESHSSVMTVREILQHSSNVGTIRVAGLLGPDRLDHYLRAFGFGVRTGLAFPGEADGIMLPLAQYNDTSMGSIPIGNGIAVTALQMVEVYATIANAGMARPPRLVSATIDEQGHTHEIPLAAPHPVVSPTTSAAVTDMLRAVVDGGTGVKAKVSGYPTAGKTGTARKPPYEHPPYRYVASFAGFAPADNPRLAAIVVLDEPSGGSIFAADVAAPVFRQVMQYALTAERIPPTEPVVP